MASGTVGTALLASGANWSSVRELLGHSGIPKAKGRAIKHLRAMACPERRAIGRGGPHLEFFVPAEVIAAATAANKAIAADDAERKVLRLPRKLQEEAERRLSIVLRYVELRGEGKGASTAARAVGTPYNTLLRWHRQVKDKPRSEWLSLLVPAWSIEAPRADIHPDDWRLFLSMVMRRGGSTMVEAYRKTAKRAADEGRQLPTYRTFCRRYDREIDSAVDALARGGERALDDLLPTQERNELVFGAYQALVMDGRYGKRFVDWGNGQVGRPITIRLEDIRTRYTVAHGVYQTESSDAARDVLLSAFKRYKLPERVVFDNSRGFAAKQISGGTPLRYRWAVAAEEQLGILPRCGVHVQFASPYKGRAKPVERRHRDDKNDIDRHPAFAGYDGYFGDRDDARPDEFKGQFVPADLYARIVAGEIEEGNNRPGRRTRACDGKLSFRQAFEADYCKTYFPAELNAAQERHFFRNAARVTVLARGVVKYRDNRYASPELLRWIGKKVNLLFDPHNQHAAVGIESLDHRLIVEGVKCIEPIGFNDSERGREANRGRNRHKKAVRQQLAALELIKGARLADALAKRQTAPTAPDAKIVRPFPKKPPAPVNDTTPAPRKFTREELSNARERIASARAAKAERIR